MKKKFYVTTPIYYVNNKPHIGHAYTTIAADVLARFYRQKEFDTFFLTGTDEHGANIEAIAKTAGQEPQAFVDGIAESFKQAWKLLDIKPDRFIRTTESRHMAAVQTALKKIYEQGDIYLGEYSGLYCPKCEQFKNAKDLVDGLCPDHKIAPQQMDEASYMFKLSKYSDILLKKIESGELEIFPLERKNEVVSFYRQDGLQDVSFSRKNVSWGIPLPWDKTHTTYVWADAFLNYLTGLDWAGDNTVPDFWPADVHLMSKDILRVHATIWPAMLLSLGLPLPKKLFIHGYFLVDGQKMSKSIGNVIAPAELVARYGADATRYLLLSATPFGNDGDISLEGFDEKYNADLANNLGNLVSRVTNMLEQYCGGKIPDREATTIPPNLEQQVSQAMSELKFESALRLIRDSWSVLNLYIDEHKPWDMAKDPARQGELEISLSLLANSMLVSAGLLEPFLPGTAEKIIGTFAAEKIIKGEALFRRI